MTSPAWSLLVSLLAGTAGQGGQSGTLTATTCPSAVEVRHALGVERSDAPAACRVLDEGHGVALMAAVIPPDAGSPARVVAALSIEGHKLRGEKTLPRKASRQLPVPANEWKIEVAPADLKGADWLRVDVTAAAGDDLFTAQTMVSFFMAHRGKLRHLWTGLGERHERRFDACVLDTAAGFRLLDDGALARERVTTRTFRDPGLTPQQLGELDRACVAAAPTRETFQVADDGIDSDVPISDDLRAKARHNRILSLRARTSPEALGQFVTSSLALVPELEKALMSDDVNVENASINVTGATAFFMDSGGQSGLYWPDILSVVDPIGRPLALALADLRNSEGAWVEARTDYGGCHKPESATEPLHRVVEAWQAAPLPYRKAFEIILAADLREMSHDDCVCAKPDQRRELQRALNRNADIIGPLPGGAEAARALRAIPSLTTVHFDCSPG